MRLLRVGALGEERPAMLCAQGLIRDLSGHIGDIDGDTLSPAGLDRLRAIDATGLPVLPAGKRIGACIARVSKIICLGLNYTDAAKQLGLSHPAEPVLFAKAPSSLSGPNDDVPMPRGGMALDYEAELAVIIGTRAKDVSPEDALAYVAGYAAFNDVSERVFQTQRGGQWIKGKSHDGFGPIGPWIATVDEVPRPQALDISLRVNGEPRQFSSTARMIFPVAEIVSQISRYMTLEPGDVIPTGTPPGVGMGMKPPQWLRAGDVIELTVSGLGTQRQRVTAP